MIVFEGTKPLYATVREPDGEEDTAYFDVKDLCEYVNDKTDKAVFYLYSPTKKKEVAIAAIEPVIVSDYYEIGTISGHIGLKVSPDTTFIKENGDMITAENLTHAFNKLTFVKTDKRRIGIYSAIRKEPPHTMYKITLKEEAAILAYDIVDHILVQ